ncbi:hypothetical protein CKM354_000641400 [Cercospora kikuchii]|uniref:Uncharacterized protein n=1 Tax=Cercospora kikuchii TaxID=84275 RepID=A0A9P3CJB8_9PEZI|nr:uncharacterized protein CKM354_000641400 [Cercospora kikuchii]GIZ43176.1 hypothetical protein CKM354_000641400 [Cercospora kikuchii]
MLFPNDSTKPGITVIRDHSKYWNPYPRHPNPILDVDTGVIVVQNIDLPTMSVLGEHYDIDPVFFAHHALRMQGDTRKASEGGIEQSFEALYVITSWEQRSDEELILAKDLVLVDLQASFAHLWYDWQYLQQKLPRSGKFDAYALNHHVVHFLSERWSRQLLNAVDTSVHNGTWGKRHASMDDDARSALGSLCWLLSTASLNLTLELLSLSVDEIALSAIERPGTEVLAELASCRRRLHETKVEMELREQTTDFAVKQWALNAHGEFTQRVQRAQYSFLSRSWTEQWTSMHRQAEELSTSLNDSFQMLIGAMAVQDSAVNKKQAERATMLTLLAAIYLPLTLATGIFGMNIREIEQGVPSWWWVIIVMLVLMTPSIIFVIYLFTKNRLRTLREQRAQRQNEKMV